MPAKAAKSVGLVAPIEDVRLKFRPAPGVAAVEAEVRAFPNVTEWNDGSLIGYGVEGSVAGAVDDAATTGGDSATQLAFLSVTGQNCLYNVWSRRSETELLDVIGRLRFVEGLGAPSG